MTGTMTAIDPDDVRRACQPNGIAYRPRDAGGLGLRFEPQGDDSYATYFDCDPQYQGYPDRLHGGVVATLLDAVMSHCVFALGLRGVTARLNLRYRHPVKVNQEAVIRAWIVNSHPPLFEIKAELEQEGEVRVLGDAKFFGEPLSVERSAQDTPPSQGGEGGG